MSDNPYEPPQTPTAATGVLSGDFADVRSVAKYQKAILICILIQIGAVISQFALPPALAPLLGIAMIGVSLISAILVFLLAIKVYGVGLGIVLGVLALVPLLGLLILLMVNGKATRILTDNGIKVGLLGARSGSY